MLGSVGEISHFPSIRFTIAMTKSSSTPTVDASVEASPHVSRIKIDIMLEHGGGPGDIVSMHEGFFEALDSK